MQRRSKDPNYPPLLMSQPSFGESGRPLGIQSMPMQASSSGQPMQGGVGAGAMPSFSGQPMQPQGPTGPIRRASPVRPGNGPSAGGLPQGARPKNPATIAPGQPAPSSRQRDKFVPLPSFHTLPDGEHEDQVLQQQQQQQQQALQPLPEPHPGYGIFEDLPVQPPIMPVDTSRRGRITLYCIAETFDRKKLDELLKLTYSSGSIMSYPDCFYVDYMRGGEDEPGGDIFFFDYGVVACWGMAKNQERTVVRGIARQVQEKPLAENEIEIDEFQYNFSVTEKPHVQNDTVTLNKRFIHDHEMKLAISYALAQSTKLSMYERRVVDIVLESKNLPESLAERGEVDISSNEIAKLIGKVFLQKSAVNLLSSVLDTPEFFWHAPDNFQTLYTRVIEYLELGTRVELLNSRFSVLQEMLDMLRDHQNNYHSVRLEWIVIWLIVVEVVVGVFELLGLFGFVGQESGRR